MKFASKILKNTIAKKIQKISPPTVGLEPTTTRLRALRSTNWAKRVCCKLAVFLANIGYTAVIIIISLILWINL